MLGVTAIICGKGICCRFVRLGEYAIVISGGILTNGDSYQITYVNGKLTVTDKIVKLSAVRVIGLFPMVTEMAATASL